MFGYCGAILVGLGLFGLVTIQRSYEKYLPSTFSEAACFFSSASLHDRGAAAGLGADPVPQALVITGIVVAFSATAMAVALLVRLNKETGRDHDEF